MNLGHTNSQFNLMQTTSNNQASISSSTSNQEETTKIVKVVFALFVKALVHFTRTDLQVDFFFVVRNINLLEKKKYLIILIPK